MTLSFGVTLPHSSDPPALAADVRTLEELGFDCVYAGDHIPGHWMEPVSFLSWVAGLTGRMHVATLVAAIDFRNPVILAKAAATLDRVSGGRFQLGIGAGWWDKDYRMLGLPFDPPAVRLRRMEEAAALLRKCWQNEPFDFEGQFFRVHGVEPGPEPHTPGGPPIMIGGGGPLVMRIAGRVADIIGPAPRVAGGKISRAFFQEMHRDEVARKIATATAAAERAGRDPASLRFQSMVNYLAVTSSTAEAADLHRAISDTIGLETAEVADAPTVLVGTPEQLAERVRADHEELGFSDWVLASGQIRGFGSVGMETFRCFAADVLPGLRTAAPGKEEERK